MYVELFLEAIIPYITAILETIGVFIIVLSSIRAIIYFVKNKFDFTGEGVKISLAKGLALSLEFKLAAEILKTVIIRTLNEFVVLAAVVILRVILTLVIHWEIKSSKEFDELNSERE
ncbi:MAG: DUF1622 domain-containing protein [Andreesenia angusta]|nr:DUF1622 domain-containing protein [Andreesenia angusta]